MPNSVPNFEIKDKIIIEKSQNDAKNSGLDRALKFTAIALVLFIISIEVMFYICRDVPEPLVVGVLGTGGAECGFGALIYIFKSKWAKAKQPDDDEEPEEEIDEEV